MRQIHKGKYLLFRTIPASFCCFHYTLLSIHPNLPHFLFLSSSILTNLLLCSCPPSIIIFLPCPAFFLPVAFSLPAPLRYFQAFSFLCSASSQYLSCSSYFYSAQPSFFTICPFPPSCLPFFFLPCFPLPSCLFFCLSFPSLTTMPFLPIFSLFPLNSMSLYTLVCLVSFLTLSLFFPMTFLSLAHVLSFFFSSS